MAVDNVKQIFMCDCSGTIRLHADVSVLRLCFTIIVTNSSRGFEGENCGSMNHVFDAIKGKRKQTETILYLRLPSSLTLIVVESMTDQMMRAAHVLVINK